MHLPIVRFYQTFQTKHRLYKSGHGLGHATRSLLIVEYLLSRGAKVDIISSIDSSFFVSSLSHLITDDSKNQLECFQRCLDSGAIQEHSLKGI